MIKLLKYFFLPLLLIILASCSEEIEENDLIDGEWEATAGYLGGEPDGDPYGSSVITEGFYFKDETTVYVEAYEEDFEYNLVKDKGKTIIEFSKDDLGVYLRYYIEKVDKDAIGLRGVGELQEDESCYLERK